MTPDHPLRRCSDKECTEARSEWLKETLLPQLRVDFAKIIIACVLGLGGLFMLMNHSSITSHELSDTRTYETQPAHTADMLRIESQIRELKIEMKTSSDQIIQRLDRNYGDPLRKN
jgi:hypothetical protein